MPFAASSGRFGKIGTKWGSSSRCPTPLRSKGVMVNQGLFDRVADAFVSRWLAGQDTFTIWSGVMSDFPAADRPRPDRRDGVQLEQV